MSKSRRDADFDKECWVSLPIPPHTLNMPKRNAEDNGYFSNVVSVNNEIVVSSKREYSSRRITFFKYSPFINQWNKFHIHQYSDCRKPHGYFLTMDEERKKLFLFEGRNKINPRRINAFEVWAGNMITNQWLQWGDETECKFTEEEVGEVPVEILQMFDQYPLIHIVSDQMTRNIVSSFGVAAIQKQLWKGVVIAYGVAHLLVVNRVAPEEFQLRHFVLGEDAQDFSELFTLAMPMEFHKETIVINTTCEMTFFAIFVPRLNYILLIHGSDHKKKGAVWKFGLDNLKWRKEAGLAIPNCTSSGALTADQKHVVFAGFHQILVLDISDGDNFKIRKSSIILPMQMIIKSYSDSMVRTGGGLWNEMLISGWTRSLFKTKRFADSSFPPLYLLQLIGHWISIEELHYIYRRRMRGRDGSDIPHWPRHFTIPMKRILAVTTCLLTQEFVDEE